MTTVGIKCHLEQIFPLFLHFEDIQGGVNNHCLVLHFAVKKVSREETLHATEIDKTISPKITNNGNTSRSSLSAFGLAGQVMCVE